MTDAGRSGQATTGLRPRALVVRLAVVLVVAAAVVAALLRIWDLAIPLPPDAVCSAVFPPDAGCAGDDRLVRAGVWTAILALGVAACAVLSVRTRPGIGWLVALEGVTLFLALIAFRDVLFVGVWP